MTNTGTVAGAAVAQVYVATPFTVSGVQLPIHRLEGFQKTAVLAPGASQQVTVPIKVSDLAFWDATNMKSVVYDGNYQFQVGDNAGHILSTATAAVTGAITPQVQYVTVQPESVVFNAGDTFNLTGKNQWLKDDTNTSARSAAQPDRDRGQRGRGRQQRRVVRQSATATVTLCEQQPGGGHGQQCRPGPSGR